MRVLLMSSSSGSLGGGEQYVSRLAAGLSRQGIDVTIGMSSHARMDALAKECSPFGNVVRVRYDNTYDRLFRCGGAVAARTTIARVKSLFESLNVDLVHINKQNVEDGLDLMLGAAKTDIATVATVHIARSMCELKSRGGWIRDRLASRILRRSNSEFITVAQHCGKQLLDTCPGLSPERVHAVWNGVEEAPRADREAIRREWGFGPDDLVLGCVGRVEPQKNPLFALKLLHQLPENVKLVWVGDGALRSEFERCAQTLGLAGRVRLEGWRMDARQRMVGFDVFTLPSEYEGFPFAVLEAMAAGLPCVVSDVDGTREAVVDGATGFLCGSNENDAWFRRLQMLASDASLRRRLGAEGRVRMLKHFSLEAMASATSRVYEHAIGRR
jgi:glycosyltransferase involved in cell wall biosynthesis